MVKPNVPKSRLRAAAIARKAWSIKPKQVAVRGNLRIPTDFEQVFDKQDSALRGSTWVDGIVIAKNSLTLYRVLKALSGHGVSIIAGEEITLISGQQSFTGLSCVDALLKAIAFYLPSQDATVHELDERLQDIDIFE